MEGRVIKLIVECTFDKKGRPIFGKWCEEKQYYRKKKLKQLKTISNEQNINSNEIR